MDERADPRLIALMLAGDQQAFGTLIERYEAMAQHLAVQFTGNLEVARELVQEATVQAYLSLDHLRNTTRFKSWFYGITLNVCRNYRREQKLRQVSLETLVEEQPFAEIGLADVIQQDPYSIAVLVGTDGQRALPLWIGYWEGQAILSTLQNMAAPGPFSFTLMTDLLQAAESTLEEVRLETLKDEILYAVIRLRHGKSIKEVEARSSDALALAAQTNCTLSIADDIWNSMSIELPQAQTKPSQQDLEHILRIMRERHPQEPLTWRNLAPFAQNPRNLDGAEGTNGWFMTGSHSQNYDYLFDTQVKQDGLGSFSLKAKVSETGGHGAFLQSVKADAYRGKLVRFAAKVKTQDVQPRATLMLYAYGASAVLKYTSNAYGPLTGTQVWTSCEALLKVPEECVHVTFGVVLAGSGQVWFNEIQLTTVDQPLPQRELPAASNTNLDLTRGAVKQVIFHAQEEARRFQHNYIGTEHLLLGILHEPASRAVVVLQSLNVNAERVRGAVETVLAPGDRTVIGTVGLTPRAKKALELAVDEARLLDQQAPVTEHILLGLIREGEGIAARVLQSLGVRYKDVLAQSL